MPNGAAWSPTFPLPKPTGVLACIARARSSTPSSTSLKSGCAWRLLPHDFPPWKTVYHYFRFWRLDGTWERMHSALRKRVRVRLKRNPQPSAGDSGQPVGQDHGRGRRRARLRRGQEGQGTESVICWWTRRVWCSKPGSTARTSRTATASSSCWNPRSDRLPKRLSHLWLDAGYTGQEDRGAGWVQKTSGMDGRDRSPPQEAGSRGGDDGRGLGSSTKRESPSTRRSSCPRRARGPSCRRDGSWSGPSLGSPRTGG